MWSNNDFDVNMAVNFFFFSTGGICFPKMDNPTFFIKKITFHALTFISVAHNNIS